MNIPASAIQKTKVGTCPHGLPLGACPICNGMGGGGGGAKRTSSSTKNAGEMSWDQCFAIWQQILKAKDLAQQKQELAMQARLQMPNAQTKLENLAQNIANLVQKLTQLNQKGQMESLPKIISRPLALMAKMAIPVLNVVKNIAVATQKVINFVQGKFADISDKLSAVFGELKNSMEKKISERFTDFKKKFKSLFGILEPAETDDEDKKIEESKRLFELKTILQSLKEKIFRNPQEQKEIENAGS